ncbi:hypothetical protein J5Y03_12015 [Bacillus sp. RG28]|uniref:Uncharacterized protein n=1 Tax=Gottfriedia endophytica TaxID=2820819 RepID=A0A940SJX0_9BACI|nr:hypothetical protein [Gottfriedia endophytica]MBP0725896.1 hypothetical protein [Gottfriedia endophytica]
MSSSIFNKKKKRSAVLLNKQHSFRLLKSKKKRIVEKRQIQLNSLSMHENTSPVENVKTENRSAIKVIETISIEGLPVTFLLKLGKQYFSDLEAVKYYYNANHEQFYKNRSLLEDSLKSSISSSNDAMKKDIKSFIENR